MGNNKVVKNFIWRLAERCGAQIVTFTSVEAENEKEVDE